MRGYICLSLLLGVFLILTVRYSFWVAFGIMYFAGTLVVIGTAFTVSYIQKMRSKASILDDQPVYLKSQKLLTSKNLHAV